jgi:oxalate decarboxylase/phosphoglucose isomerase-like protein (cupin superfamily)
MGDISFQNNVPDPLLAGKELPTFKFELEKSKGKVLGNSFGKEATVEQLPISKGIAAVSMQLEPGVMRELHWHATAAESAFVLKGRVRTTVINPVGQTETNHFDPGDIWYFPRGHPHVLECLGNEPTHFILIFDNGYFSEFGTFSITGWLGHAPKSLLAKILAYRNQRLTDFLRRRFTSGTARFRRSKRHFAKSMTNLMLLRFKLSCSRCSHGAAGRRGNSSKADRPQAGGYNIS